MADPNSIHDLKWMQSFTEENEVFLIARKQHLAELKISSSDFYNLYGIQIIGSIDDFSVVWFWKSINLWKQLQKIVSTWKIDLFHVLYAEPNALVGLYKKSFTIPFVLTTRGTDILKTIPTAFKKNDLLNRVVSLAYRKAFHNFDCITCTSELQIRVIQDLKLTKTSPVLIRTGINTERIDQVINTNESHPLTGKNFILFPRNMRPLYNHEFALESIRLLPDEVLKKYHMVFLNADSKDKIYVTQIRKLMKEIPANFIFLNTQPQETLWLLNKDATLIVMTPKSDGAPVSAMEALYCGSNLILPPLTYDQDLFSQNVVQFASWNPLSLAKSIVEVLQKGNSSSDISKRIILEKGNTSTEMKKLNQIYQRFWQNEAY